MLWWVGTPAGLLVAVGALWGPLAVGLGMAQALMAIFVLEDVNYIEHYGLQRALTRSGRYIHRCVHQSSNRTVFLYGMRGAGKQQ